VLLSIAVSVAWKILLSAGIPVAMLVVVATPSIRRLDATGDSSRRALRRVAPVVRDVAAADEAIATLSRVHGRWSAMPDPAYEALWTTRMNALEQRLGSLRRTTETPAEVRRVAKAGAAVERYRALISTRADGAFHLRRLTADERGLALRLSARARRALATIGDGLEATARAAEAQATAIERTTGDTLRGAATLAGLLALVLATLTSWRLVRRLRRLAWVSEALERGRLDEPVAIGGRDELGRLAVALEALGHDMRERECISDAVLQQLGHDLRELLHSVRDASRLLVDELIDMGPTHPRRLAAYIGDVTTELLDRVERIGGVHEPTVVRLPVHSKVPTLIEPDRAPLAEDGS
jgi:hypothetical protein